MNLNAKKISHAFINFFLNLLFLYRILSNKSSVLVLILIFFSIYTDVKLSNIYTDDNLDFKSFIKNIDKSIIFGASLLYMSIMFVVLIVLGILINQSFSFEIFGFICFVLYSLFRYWILKNYLNRDKLGFCVYLNYMLSFVIVFIFYVLLKNKMHLLSVIALILQVNMYIFSIKKITFSNEKRKG